MSIPATLTTALNHTYRVREATSASPKSPARRVLADLTPKAMNVSPNNNTALAHLEGLKNRSPLKQVQTMSSPRQLDTENMPELRYPGQGRKRCISEVEGAVAREDALEYTHRAIDERDGSMKQTFKPGVLAKMRVVDTAPVVDLLGDGCYSFEEEHEREQETQVSQETNVTNASFSSLINYNPDGSSSQNRVSPPPEEPVVTSQAETLRLRLRMAMYKVRTNQTAAPFAELSLPAAAALSNPPLLHPSTSDSLTNSLTNTSASLTQPASTSTTVPSITLSPALSSNPPKSAPIPTLLPAPVLLPTAYSTRFITADGVIPSSPPTSVSPIPTHIHPQETSPSRSSFVTPVAQRRAAFAQLSSPPESGGMDTGRRLERRFEEGELTSSVVKGRAASGLMELMKAGGR